MAVRDVLGMVFCREFENLQVVFLLGFHAVNAVPEDYLCQYRDCFTDSSGAVSRVAEHFCHLLCGSVMRFVSKTKSPVTVNFHHDNGAVFCCENLVQDKPK